jgi:ammonium transporter, Amt family
MEDQLAGLAYSIDNIWVIIAGFLVFFMQAGFALVESGFTRSKNTTNILMKNVMDFCMGTLSFWAVGWAFMYGDGTPFIGLSQFFLIGASEIDYTDPAAIAALEGGELSIYVDWFFQLVFAATAATIVSGAMSERTRFVAYFAYSIAITAVIYPIFGHWTWGGGLLNDIGFLGGASFSDFAGSTIVHSVGGWAALVGAWMLGPRKGRYDANGNPVPIPGHSIALGALGVFILWLGWFGFNPGSQLAAAGFENIQGLALVAANTNIAAAAGAFAAMGIAWVMNGKPDLSYTLNGALGGLVAITAPCAVVVPWSAVVIGLVAGIVVFVGMNVLEKAKIDDPVGAVPVHLFAGIWGTLALGVFATDSGLLYGGGATQLMAQIAGVVTCGVWTAGTAFIVFYTIKKTIGLRVTEEEEELGLDIHEHGSEAYPDLRALRANAGR